MWKMSPKARRRPQKFEVSLGFATREFVEHRLWSYKDHLKTKCARYCPICFGWYIPKDGERNCKNSHCQNFVKDVLLLRPKYHTDEAMREQVYEMYRLPPEDYLKDYAV